MENNLPPNSCDGDPAPNRAPAAALLMAFGALLVGTGKRMEPPEGGSMGEVVPVEEAPERGGCEVSWGR